MKAILRKDGCLEAISERPVDFIDDNKWIEMDGNAMANFHLVLADEVLSSIEEKKTSTDSYDQLIINLTNSNVTSLVFDDVAAVVLQEENRRKNKEDRQVNLQQAEVLTTMRGRSTEHGQNNSHKHGRSKSRSKKNLKCYNCGKKGHLKNDCWCLNKNSNTQGNTANTSDDGDALCCEASTTVEGGSVYSFNDHALEIVVVGAIKLKIFCNAMASETWTHVSHYEPVPGGSVYSFNDHAELGHMSEQGMKVLMEQKLLPGLTKEMLGVPIKKKSDVFSTFKNFKARVELDSGNKIKCFRTDNGGEYTSEEFDDFCRKEDIKRQFTVVNTPQQNGVAERMNRTLLERTREMLRDAGLEKSFWAEAVNTACYLVNRAPSTTIELKTSMQMWTGKSADYSNLHVFGSIVYVMYNSQEISKLDPKSRKCKFLGYANGVKGYRLWDPTARKVIISRDDVEQGDSSEAGPAHEEQEPESSEAPTTRQSDQIEALHKNYTWDFVPLPQGRKPIGNKWVFKIKRNGDDQVERYRARLVVKGYAQKECIDFNEIFSPVVRLTTFQVVLAMCATLNLHLEQLDVKTTFLHGNLEEEIYMLQPEGFEEKEKKNLDCRLNKSLYILNQASRCWYKRFDSFIMCLGYNRLNADACAYFKRSGDNDFVILMLYVDDMLVAGPNKDHIEELKAQLAREFEIKDLGSADKILGIFNMQDCKPMSTPLPINFKLSSNISQAVGVVSRYMANPGKEHWNTVKRILRYIKGTSNVALCYGGSNLLINGQLWLHPQQSQIALHLARNPTFHSRTKHIRVQYHFIREKVEEGMVYMQKIHTKDNIAYLMTKVINADKFTWCRSSCGLSETCDFALSDSRLPQQLKWRFSAGRDITSTPSVFDGAAYFSIWDGYLYAVKESDGSLIWKQNLQQLTGINSTGVIFNVNVRASRTTPTIADDLVIIGISGPASVVAVKQSSGELGWSTLLDANPAGTITMSGTYYNGFVKLNAKTGKILWQTFMLPDNFGNSGEYAGAAIWGSSPPINVVRNLMYIATGNLYSAPQNITDCQERQNNQTQVPPTHTDECVEPDNHSDPFLALDLDTGNIKWFHQLWGYDVWFFACNNLSVPDCPPDPNPDADFGEAPMMLSIDVNGTEKDIVVAVQNKGFAWALDRNDGNIIWYTEAGHGGLRGGGTWGAVTDEKRVYTNIANSDGKNFTLKPSTRNITAGGWVAMDANNGQILWSTGDPNNDTASGPVTVANGVLFGGSTYKEGPV
ncbi:putative Retrotransposon protein, Ty3-gypsy subclass [Hibiscus syriacus]|uniref:Retrotransposon protein, Ty3-gypsy subclass n=1 Tax=Hibiscus syriacus TaxID=106335 RepID=A0A6A2ZDZ9_HIBSY|nr:putative Retrotransposon protein, Ty3-gypsy subclass [Hibiscus syriacus]